MTDEFVPFETNLKSLSDYSLQWNRWILKPIGAWPPSSSTSKLERTMSFILIIICYLFILSTIIPYTFYIILEDESLHIKLKAFGPLCHWFVGGVNYTTLLLHSKEIRGCVHHIRTDWKIVTRVDYQRVMMKNAKVGRFVATFCAAFMQGGVLSYCALLAFTTQTNQVGNETRSIHQLPCSFCKDQIPVDTSPTNEIVLAWQFVCGLIVNSSAIGAISLAAVFGAHACGQLNVVMAWITEFVNKSRDQNRNDCLNEIGVIVEHHLRTLSFIERIENVMNEIFLMELLKSTLSICMLEYYILTEWSDHDVQHLTIYFATLFSLCFNLFTVCYIGDILTEQIQRCDENHRWKVDSVIVIMVALLDNDSMYSVQMNRWFLKSIGAWPLSLCVDTTEKINSVILGLISCFLIGFLLLPCVLCTFLDTTGDLDAKIKMIGPLSFCVMAAIKYYILVSRGAKIGKCVEDIRADWVRTHSEERQEDRYIMRDNARIGRSLAIFCAGFMYSGGFFYTIVMPLCTKRTEMIGNETVRSQAFPIYRGLFDPRTSPSFEIVQLAQCLAGFVIYTVTVGACSLAAVFVMHSCGQFNMQLMTFSGLNVTE